MRRSALYTSAAFHMVIFFFAVTGLPFLAKHEFVIPPPIVVDFIDISKVTETDKVLPKPVAPPEKPEPKKEDKPPPAAPVNTATEAAPPVKDKPKPVEKKEMKKEAKAEEIDPNALPEKNKKAKKEKPEDAAKKEPPKDFSSVLKNLAVKAAPDMNTGEKPAPPAPGQNAPIGAKMTMSEEDALRAQLGKCWNVPFGAKDAENMSVDIFMVINPDRTLREARIVNTARYNSDNFFRAAADSALRAVRNPLCSPFDVPPDKYDTWNTITVTFNPKDMF